MDKGDSFDMDWEDEINNNLWEPVSDFIDAGASALSSFPINIKSSSTNTKAVSFTVTSNYDISAYTTSYAGFSDYKSTRDTYTYEPLNAEMRQRKEGTPVGLKNKGGTYFFNSLIQTYFMIPKLVQEILQFKIHPTRENSESEIKQTSIKLVEELQKLFAFMIRSNKKYVDPVGVLDAIVDDFGKKVYIGMNTDIGEFNMTLVARIEEGLKAKFPIAEAKKEEEKEGIEKLLMKKWLSSMIGNNLAVQGYVSQLFYAKQLDIVTATNEDGSPFFIRKPSVFGKIELNVFDRNLYSAWDTLNYSKTDEYWIEEYKTSAIKEKWIEKLPGMLLFQINRITISGKEKSKCYNQFTFPKVIYPDRFLLENKELSMSRRKILSDLIEKCKELENAIDKFKNYKSGGVSLDVLFEETGKLLEEQFTPRDEIENPYPDLQLWVPENLGMSPDFLDEINPVKEYLTLLASNVGEKVKDMERQLEELTMQIQGIYDIEELKKHQYHLHSIIIHDGSMGSSYYYAYVFDAEYEQWRKYNDIYVSDVTEKEVMEYANGGKDQATAHCLIYIDNSLIPKIPKGLLRSYTLSSKTELVTDHYKSLISNELKQIVEEDNQKYETELMEYKVSSVVRKITDFYAMRQSQAFAQHLSFKNRKQYMKEFTRHELINFAVWLKIRDEEQLSRWFIFDLSVKDCTPDKRSFQMLNEEEILYVRLRKQLKVVREPPFIIELSERNEEVLQREKAAFYKAYFQASLCTYIMENLIQDNLINAAHGIAWILSFGQDDPSEYLLQILKLNQALMLRITSHIIKCLKAKKNDGSIKLANYGAFLVSKYIDKSSQHYGLFQRRLRSALNVAENEPKENSEAIQVLNKIIEDFNNNQFSFEFEKEEIPESLKTIEKKFENFDYFSWIEGWRKEEVANSYISATTNLSKSKFNLWLSLSEKLSSNNPIDDYEFDQADSISSDEEP